MTVAPELADSIGSFLVDQGAPGLISEEDGASVRLTAHFPGAAPVDALTRFAEGLRDIFPDAPPARVETCAVPEADWAENWKDHFPPIAVGERLFVHPPWIAAVPSGRVGIMIDPGMAFGTGQHPTTRGCLVLLERAQHSKPGARVCDVGTGSGILAIAAAKLGAAEVWATDIDVVARAVAEANLVANGVAEAVHVGASLDDIPGQFDIVVANLLGHLLIELAAAITARLAPRGVAIGSGLRTEEEDAVAAAWRAAGLVPLARYDEDGWVTLMCQPS